MRVTMMLEHPPDLNHATEVPWRRLPLVVSPKDENLSFLWGGPSLRQDEAISWLLELKVATEQPPGERAWVVYGLPNAVSSTTPLWIAFMTIVRAACPPHR